jgi:3D (Asp-Asp-Asp) domain-containing protein
VAAVILGATAGGSSGATGKGTQLGSLATAERSAVLDLFAAEASLARARSAADRLQRRRQALEVARDRTRAQAEIVQGSLAATRVRIATLLRRLYMDGDADPIAVLLGARSLPGMLAGIEALERATLRNRGLAAEARAHARTLRVRLVRLARARAELSLAKRRADLAVLGLEAAAAAKRQAIAGIQRRQRLTRARVAQLESRAKAAQRASARLARASAPAPVASVAVAAPAQSVTASAPLREPAAPEVGAAMGRTLVVDAVAYHLPGRTASGLPVGVGVIAVDPSVIPLGTRMFVPGYGPAVAADVGSAIRGALIDLWMPSTAAARAWGRRTVTITVYG